jgi:hypothetical protein
MFEIKCEHEFEIQSINPTTDQYGVHVKNEIRGTLMVEYQFKRIKIMWKIMVVKDISISVSNIVKKCQTTKRNMLL